MRRIANKRIRYREGNTNVQQTFPIDVISDWIFLKCRVWNNYIGKMDKDIMVKMMRDGRRRLRTQ